MTLADLSIRRPVFAWMLMFSLIGFGALSFFRLGVSQLPDVDFPIVTISLKMDGASPETMEQTVIDLLEDRLMSIQGVKSIKSSAGQNKGTITVEFEFSRDIDLALQDVQAKVAQAAKNLPKQLEPASFSKTNPDDMPIVILALEAEGYKPLEIMKFARNTLKNQIAGASGVGDVGIGGYLEPNMRVWVQNEKLDQFYLGASDVVETLKSEQTDPPAGTVKQDKKVYSVRFMGEASTPADLSLIPLLRKGGQEGMWRPPTLGQVARIEEGTEDVFTIARANQKPAVTFAVVKQRGSNAVEVAKSVRVRVDEIQKTLPKGMRLLVVFDSTKFIEEAVGELNFTLVLSAILTALVCWLFLGSWSSTFNVLLAIPTSIIGAFAVIHFMGFTLNTFTLLALSLAIGIVVDDAIMVLENIIRHRELGKNPVRAALDGAKEISFAATAASISVISIFLPVAFMKGLIGKYFYQFGVVISATVVISLIEALTITPMRAAFFKGSVKTDHTDGTAKRSERFFKILSEGYANTLEVSLKYKWVVIFVCVIFSVWSFSLFPKLKQEFIPPEDQSRFMVRMQTPVGSSIDYTNEKLREVEAILAKDLDVFAFVTVAGANQQGGDFNNGMAFVTLKPPKERVKTENQKHARTQADIMGELRRQFLQIKDVKVSLQDLAMRGLTTSRGMPIEFTVQGPEWTKLAEHAKTMIKEMKATEQIIDIDSDFKDGMLELQIKPDREKISSRGVTMASVASVISSMMGGQIVNQYSTGGNRYDIRLRMDGVEDVTKANVFQVISRLKVRNQANTLIPLSELVNVEERTTSQSISRLSRERAITVYANVTPGTSQQLALTKIQEIAKTILPEGYKVKISGSSATFKESFDSLIFALLLGIAVAYMILATQFNSFIDPVSVLVALPLSVTGAFLALKWSAQSINIYSMIGLILLMGIAKKNSILLVEFTNHVQEFEKLKVREAIMKACPIRLRPILMTSLATVAGAIPPALALGPGAESRIPMAVAIIGGVLISTVFTLYFVPCVSLVLAPLKRSVSLISEAGESEDLGPSGSGTKVGQNHSY